MPSLARIELSLVSMPPLYNKCEAANPVCSLSPFLRGEGRGEGQIQTTGLRIVPLTRTASRPDLSPQAGTKWMRHHHAKYYRLIGANFAGTIRLVRWSTM